MRFDDTMEHIGRGFELVGVVTIAVGGLLAIIKGLRQSKHPDEFFIGVRRSFGRPLILGLEILVAADIILTITVEPTLESVLALGILVLIRVVLSFSLDIEVDGIVPWRRSETGVRVEEST